MKISRELAFAQSGLLVAGLLFASSGVGSAVAAPVAQTESGAQTWTGMVGQQIFTQEGDKPTWQALKYYPGNITVHVGDTVNWKFDAGAEPHTVTLMGPETALPETPLVEPPAGEGPPTIVENPLLVFRQGGDTYDGTAFTSSGFISADIPGPKEYSLRFTTAGTYEYLCVLHAFPDETGKLQGMVGTITVVDAAAALPMTTAQVAADVDTMMKADAAKALQLEPQAKQATASVPGPNGTMIHRLNAGFVSPEDGLEYMRYSQDLLTINVGDTVEWTPMSFHTVTFGEEPTMFNFEPQPQGPPKVIYNPLIFEKGAPVHTGTGYYNSGLMVPGPIPPEAAAFLSDKYSLTFTGEGRFEYICIPHYPQGMDATIIVQARTGETATATGAPPIVGMPTTGAGTTPVGVPAALAGLFVLALGLTLRIRGKGRAL